MAALETKAGEPLEIPGGRVRLLSRVLALRWPRRGGLIWNRPIGVVVEDEAGRRRFVPICDPTRRLQCLILAAGLAAAVFIRLAPRRPRAKRRTTRR